MKIIEKKYTHKNKKKSIQKWPQTQIQITKM